MPPDDEPTVEVFADVLCPFAHAGIRRYLERRMAMGQPDLHLWVRAWPLEVVNGAEPDVAMLGEEIEALRAAVAPDLFGGFDPSNFPSTSMPAFAVAAAAYRVGPAIGEAVSLELRHRVWEEGQDVGDPEVLRQVVEANNLDLEASDRESVEADHSEGQRRGVIGSPHFFVGGDSFFCPSFTVSHDEEGFHIEPDTERFDRFLAAVVG